MEAILYTEVFLTFCTSFLENSERENALMLFGVKVKNAYPVFIKGTLSPWKQTSK